MLILEKSYTLTAMESIFDNLLRDGVYDRKTDLSDMAKSCFSGSKWSVTGRRIVTNSRSTNVPKESLV